MKLKTDLCLVLKVKNEWSCTSTPPICLHGLEWENFTYFFRFRSGAEIDYTTGWALWGLNPDRDKKFFFSPERLDCLWGLTQPLAYLILGVIFRE
jgi:hypothetical protein